MDYDPIMLTALLGLSASVWAIMEVVKPALGGLFDRLTKTAKIPVNIQKPTKFAIWRFLGVLLGIGAVAIVEGVSFLEMWNIYLVDMPAWVDVVITGAVVGLGDRAIHWIVDGMEANGVAIADYLKGVGNAQTP